MKKKLILLCVLALLIAALAVGAHADGVVTLKAVTKTANSGDVIEIPIEITNVSGNITGPISGGLVNVSWVDSELEYQSMNPGAGLNTCEFSGTNGANIAFNKSAGISDDFTVATLTFKVKESVKDGTVTINLTVTSLELDDDDGSDIGDSVENNNPAITVTHIHSDAPAGSAAEGSEGWTVGTAATCLEAGTESYTCTYCNEAVERDVDALGHSMTEHPAQAHTCTADGNVQYWSCSNCGKNFSDDADNSTNELADVVDPAAHTFGEGAKTEAVASDCTNHGHNAYWTCSVCGKVYKDVDGEADPEQETSAADETLAELGDHTLENVPAKDATCTEDGNIEYWYCTACTHAYGDENAANGQIDLEDVPLPMLNHRNATYVEAAKPSKGENDELIPGYYEHMFCPDCKTYFYVTTDEEGTHSIDTEKDPYGVQGEDGSMPEDLLIKKVSGDVDCNGRISTADATRIMRYLAGGFGTRGEISDQGMVNADTDANGRISTADATRIMRNLAGGFGDRGELR